MLILVLLLSSGLAQVLTSWGAALSTVSMHPTFITSASIGSRIQGEVVVQNDQAYIVYFYRPNQYYPNHAAFMFLSYEGSSNFTSLPVDTDGFWRVEIMPKYAHNNFLIRVSISNGKNGRDQYVDVARDKRLFVAYFLQGQNCGFTVQGIPKGQQREISIQMYEGTANLDFSRTRLIFGNSGMTNNQYDITCTAKITGYYYIYIAASTSIMPLFTRILVNYQSDNYPCPAMGYKDVNQVFATCVQLNLNAAYPCLSYDYVLNKCTKCQDSFTLENGKCYRSVDCGLDRYFHEGNCYNVIDNCQSFQPVGGYCMKCVDGYVLSNQNKGQSCTLPNNQLTQPVVYNTSQQVSTQPFNATPTIQPYNPATIVNCSAGTYLLNGQCAPIPANCLQFNSSLRICITCSPKYTLDLNNFGCVLAKKNCTAGYINIGDSCLSMPANCFYANSWGNCTKCMTNYTLNSNNQCILIECGYRKYLSNGECLQVSPRCNAYEPTQGKCLSCLSNYLLDAYGGCNAPQSFGKPSNGCSPRHYSIDSNCFLVDSRCNTFDPFTGNCLSCNDPTFLLDKSNGKCYSPSEVCENRYFFSPTTRTCQPVNPYCNTYDFQGNCLTCTYGLTLFRGSCIAALPCSASQYRNQDGVCADADPICEGVDQNTGTCLGCKSGYELNNGGVCCYAQNYLLTPTCKSFLSQHCLAQRPNIYNCLQCQPGYLLLNGVFGRCAKP